MGKWLTAAAHRQAGQTIAADDRTGHQSGHHVETFRTFCEPGL